jgi:Uma2 family endonuclease
MRARSVARRTRDVNGQSLLLDGVSWEGYEAIADAFDQRSIRFTYDDGRLEIMTLSLEHEEDNRLFDRLIATLAAELGIRIKCYGSATCKKRQALKGLEPDSCYYLRNLARIRGKKRIDLARDPAPDLALEVDVTRKSLDRMRIYAALGVPEVWRFDGKRLQMFLLNEQGAYDPCDESPTFPGVPSRVLVRFLRIGQRQDDTAMIRAFVQWIRSHLVRE